MIESEERELRQKNFDFAFGQAWDKFWLAVTPELFKLVGWTAALAGLEYANRTAHSVAIIVIQGLLSFSMWMYLQAIFFHFEIINLPFAKSRRMKVLFAVCLTFFPSYGIYQLALYVASQLAVR